MTRYADHPSTRQAARGADVVAWRRIALEQQLPSARFPAGVRAPAQVGVFGTLAIAVLVLVLFAATSGRQVSKAVTESQQSMVRELVRSTQLGLTSNLTFLDRAIADYTAATSPNADELLTSLMPADSVWTGAVVVNAQSRTVKAKRGSAVSLPEVLDEGHRTIAGRIVDGLPVLTVVTPLTDGDVMVGTLDMRFRTQVLDAKSHQVLLVGDATTIAPLQGTGTLQADELDLVGAIVKDAISFEGSVVRHRTATGGTQTLIVAADSVGDTGIVVVSAVYEPLAYGGVWWQGTVPAGVLALMALFGWAITRMSFHRPVEELLKQAKLDACGDTAPRARIGGSSEVTRIAAALRGRKVKHRGLPLMVALSFVCAMTVLWSAGMAYYFSQRPPTISEQLMSDLSNEVESVGHELGARLDLGYRQILNLSAETDNPGARSTESALSKLRASGDRFRSAYTLDKDGGVLQRSGRAPLRSPGRLPGEQGIWLDRHNDHLPVLFAYVVRHDGTAVVGEFDVDYLTSALSRVRGHLRVLDSSLQTILDTSGFVAFSELTGKEERDSVISAFGGKTSTSISRRTRAGLLSDRLRGSTTIDEPSSVAHLEWTVLLERNVTALSVPESIHFRFALLGAALATGLAAFVLSWQYFLHVRALRALARDADEVLSGARDHPVVPRRPDEIGAIAACLEICRQVAMYGAARFGGAIRLRGSEADFTAVIPRQPATSGKASGRHR